MLMKKLVFKFWINEQDSPDRKKKWLTIIGRPYCLEKGSPNGYLWISKDSTINIPLLTCEIDLKKSSDDWAKFFAISCKEAMVKVKVLVDAEVLMNIPVRHSGGIIAKKTR